MAKRKFDFCQFYESYGVLFDADKYNIDEAINKYFIEYGNKLSDGTDTITYGDNIYSKEDLIVAEDWVKWYPKMSEDDMFYLDILDPRENRGTYRCCKPDAKRAFKCWRIRVPEEEKLYENN